MPIFKLEGINWYAVLVAAVAVFMLGGVWYTAMFGRLWQQLHGYSAEKLKEMQAKRPPPVFFGTMIVSYLVLAAGMAVLFNSFGVVGAAHGAEVGGLLWFAVAAPIGATAFIASDRHVGIYVIDLTYQLVFLAMAGAILGGWR